MYPDNGFLIAYQLGTPASQQHPLSAAIPLRERLAVSRNLSPGQVAGGVCDAQSPSPHPSPQQSYSDMDFKAYVRAGMSKLVSLSWYKRHRPEKG